MREGMAAVPLSVDLGGATEFVLEVGDAGDGISCDQADWADAKVMLDDGTAVWLGDLPLLIERSAALDRRRRSRSSTTASRRPSCSETWKSKRDVASSTPSGREHTLTYTDPKTGLVVRCVAIEYRDFPDRRMDAVLQERGDGRHAAPVRHPGRRHRVPPRRRTASSRCTTTRAAPAAAERLPAARHAAWAAARRSGSRPPAAGRPTATCPISTSSGRARA